MFGATYENGLNANAPVVLAAFAAATAGFERASATALSAALVASTKLGPPTRPFTCSFWSRKRGSPRCHVASPLGRYSTATLALRLSSPSIDQSMPMEISVGGSTDESLAAT